MILKPFMLRRIKKDVENELSDKVDECFMERVLDSQGQKLNNFSFTQNLQLFDMKQAHNVFSPSCGKQKSALCIT